MYNLTTYQEIYQLLDNNWLINKELTKWCIIKVKDEEGYILREKITENDYLCVNKDYWICKFNKAWLEECEIIWHYPTVIDILKFINLNKPEETSDTFQKTICSECWNSSTDDYNYNDFMNILSDLHKFDILIINQTEEMQKQLLRLMKSNYIKMVEDLIKMKH